MMNLSNCQISCHSLLAGKNVGLFKGFALPEGQNQFQCNCQCMQLDSQQCMAIILSRNVKNMHSWGEKTGQWRQVLEVVSSMQILSLCPLELIIVAKWYHKRSKGPLLCSFAALQGLNRIIYNAAIGASEKGLIPSSVDGPTLKVLWNAQKAYSMGTECCENVGPLK